MNSPDACNIDCLFLRTEYVSLICSCDSIFQGQDFSFISFPQMLQLRKSIFDSGPESMTKTKWGP